MPDSRYLSSIWKSFAGFRLWFKKFAIFHSKGFVTASLLFCMGAMAIVGALESGLAGNHQTLFAKSIIDGISAIVFASTLGLGGMSSMKGKMKIINEIWKRVRKSTIEPMAR